MNVLMSELRRRISACWRQLGLVVLCGSAQAQTNIPDGFSFGSHFSPRFSLDLVEPNATPYATFSSNNQRIARLADGSIVLSYIVSRDTTYMAQGLRILRMKPGGERQMLYSDTV